MMATTILIATVGGSCAPVVHAIAHHQADHVYFVCSKDQPGRPGSSRAVDGPGMVCDPGGASIVSQTGLASEGYDKVEIDDPDDLQACHAAVNRAYAAAFARDPDARIVADYTGGTKTMTASLVRVATGAQAARTGLFIVTGPRERLRVVRDGTEAAQSQDTMGIVLEEPYQEALRLADDYQYAAAASVLRRILAHQPPPAPELRQRARRLLTLCRGFDAWDRFDHAEAQALLQPEGQLFGAIDASMLATAGTLVKAMAAARGEVGAQQWGVPALLLVYDLLLNADRRAAQGRYDDAVARHYRAIELLAQTRLRAAYGIDASDVAAEKVVAWLAASPERASRGKIQTGLTEDYAILASLKDPLGVLWAAEEKRLHAGIQRRNASVLAHGLEPIRKDEYPALRDPVWAFVDAALQATGVPMRQAPAQFPHIAAEHLSG